MSINDCVRILVVGDQGVGKTWVVGGLIGDGKGGRMGTSGLGNGSLLPGSAAEIAPISSGIGNQRLGGVSSGGQACRVDVSLHTCKSGSPSFVEYWTVSGSSKFERARSAFYVGYYGVVFIYDASTSRGRQRVSAWMREIFGIDVWRWRELSDSERVAEVLMPGQDRYIPILQLGVQHDTSLNSNSLLPTTISDALTVSRYDSQAFSPNGRANPFIQTFLDQCVLQMRAENLSKSSSILSMDPLTASSSALSHSSRAHPKRRSLQKYLH